MKTSKLSFKRTKKPLSEISPERLILTKEQIAAGKPVICPHCGKEVQVTTRNIINSKKNPELVKKIIEGTYFEQKCPQCDKAFQAIYSALYKNESNRRWVQLMLFEDADNGGILDCASASSGKVVRYVQNENDFREKVTIFHRDLDDRAIELMKLITKTEAQTRYRQEVEKVYFIIGNEAFFYTILKNGKVKKALCYVEVYKSIRDDSFMTAFDECMDPVVDEAWARAYIENYKDVPVPKKMKR